MNFFSFCYEFSSFLQHNEEDGDEDKRHADELDRTDLLMVNDDTEKSSENRFESHDDGSFSLAGILLSVGLHDESDTKHHGRDVSDPWYTRKFNVAWEDIYAGCTALFEECRGVQKEC